MFRRSAILALVLLLAACGGGDSRAPFTDSRIPPSLGPRDWPPAGWTWGLIQIGDAPPQRYGVAAPDRVPRAQILILPGYGEAAEDRFSLVSGLLDQGYVVWTLDGAGQGGSGRLTGQRDLGHVDSFNSDVNAVGRLIGMVIRPAPDTPLIVIADSTAGVVALRRLQLGARDVAGLILRAPTRRDPGGVALPDPRLAEWAARLSLDAVRAPGGEAWRRDGPEIGGGRSPDIVHAWRLANPDLRMGGPSLAWIAAFSTLGDEVDRGGLKRIQIPVVVAAPRVSPSADREGEDRLCAALPHCQRLATDTDDQALGQIVGLVEPLRAARNPMPSRRALPKPVAGG